MQNKRYIAILGHCPFTQEEVEVYTKPISTKEPNAEINFFDLPREGGTDSGGWMGNICVHRYAFGDRKEEILRDILALGPCKCIITEKQDSTTQYIANIIESWGIEIVKTH